MKKTLLILVCVSLLATVVSAQDYKGKGRIIGYVVDQDGKPVEGVRVKLAFARSGDGFTVMTEKDGKWTGAWLRTGDWNLDFDKIGFQPVKKTVNIVEAARNPDMKVSLQKIEGLVLSDDLKEVLTKANALYEQKDLQAALTAYLDIMAKFPDAYPLWRNVGNCYFVMEQYDKAEEQYGKILAKDPQNADALILIGNTYANRNEGDKALEWYAKVPFNKIKDSTVLYNIGTNFYNQSKFEDALRYFGRAVEIQADNLDALYQLGLTYLNLQKNAEAIAAFESFLKHDADSERAGQVKSFLEYLRKK